MLPDVVHKLWANDMYLRFVVTQIDDDSRQPQGLFTAAYALLNSGDLSGEERTQLREIMVWFNINLPTPKRHQIGPRTIFWFKSEADECLTHIWEMAYLLDYHGYLVEMQKCKKLGNIVYQDKYQVAAFPSKDDVY